LCLLYTQPRAAAFLLLSAQATRSGIDAAIPIMMMPVMGQWLQVEGISRDGRTPSRLGPAWRLRESPKGGKCKTCGSLGEVETSFYKGRFEDEAVQLLPAFSSLQEVAANVWGGRGDALYRCPRCRTFFSYRLDYEFIIPGTEDEETLTRISDEKAAELREAEPSRWGAGEGRSLVAEAA